MTTFWGKGGILFKGGHYSRKYVVYPNKAQLSIISSLRSNLLRAILIRFSGLLVSSNQFVTMLSLIVVLFNHGKLLG